MKLTFNHSKIQILDMTFACSPYFFVDIQSESRADSIKTVMTARCSTCSPSNYNLENILRVKNIKETLQQSVCKPCPNGAVCNGIVRVLDGYWGKRSSNNDLDIFQCPKGYCCSAKSTPCVSFNTCKAGRKSTLCGS